VEQVHDFLERHLAPFRERDVRVRVEVMQEALEPSELLGRLVMVDSSSEGATSFSFKSLSVKSLSVESLPAKAQIIKLMLENLKLFRTVFGSQIQTRQTSKTRRYFTMIERGPSAYFDGCRTGRLSTNLAQAQRDYFGAHTYERTDKARGEFFHTNWMGRGGTTASSTYSI
jgi:6-phosphogluconate dehydrogenase, C-terminal domain